MAQAYFVTRLKKGGDRLKNIHQAKLDLSSNSTGVLYDGEWTPSDNQIYGNKIKASRKKIKFRHIIYRDPISNRLFDFITNDPYSAAHHIADIYKKRWAVETLFKWMKTHVNLRKTTMRNKNAIKVHIISGVLVHVLLRFKIMKENLFKITTADLLRQYRHQIFMDIDIISMNTSNYRLRSRRMNTANGFMEVLC
jgi:hypothetical protein